LPRNLWALRGRLRPRRAAARRRGDGRDGDRRDGERSPLDQVSHLVSLSVVGCACLDVTRVVGRPSSSVMAAKHPELPALIADLPLLALDFGEQTPAGGGAEGASGGLAPRRGG